jgi:uncharacterized membrane-anchored protein
MRHLILTAATATVLAYASVIALAQTAPMTEAEKKAIWDAANAASVAGPQDVTLRDQAKLHLSADDLFIPQKEAAEVMRMWGNSTSDRFYGLVFPKDNNKQWVISVDHIADGFVKDDDAKTWNADEMLQSLKDGTAAQNEERAKIGIPALDVVGWVQAPQYDASKHQLVWSLKAVQRDAAAGDPSTINYNTYALGRDGYFEINLMTTDKTIDADKAAALRMVNQVEYNAGKKYADFNPSSDRVAEYGLAALIGGVAAKKLGLLALIGVFAAKFAKVLLGVGVVASAGLFKLLGRKKSAE